MDSQKNGIVDPKGKEVPGLINTGGKFPPGCIAIPAMQIPGFRSMQVVSRGRQNHLLFIARGGLGDQVCAEPTLRYAINHFGKNNRIYLAAYDGLAELFSHLRFERIFDLRDIQPIWESFYIMETIVDQTRRDHNAHLSDEFFSHCLTNCVDFASMSALRAQLPVADREIKFDPRTPRQAIQDVLKEKAIFLHAGAHWQSKTFPEQFWMTVEERIRTNGFKPVIIGAQRKDTGFVPFAALKTSIDLRNKTTVPELIWLLKNAKVLLTNDSAPLHMAACGEAWTGFIATIKRPDYLMHWRHGKFGWREQNFSRGGQWDYMDQNPGAENEFGSVERVPEDALLSWLPDPIKFADWACEKYSDAS